MTNNYYWVNVLYSGFEKGRAARENLAVVSRAYFIDLRVRAKSGGVEEFMFTGC